VARSGKRKMASSTSGAGSGADEIRYRSYLTQLERQQDAEIKDKENEHQNKVARLVTTESDQETELRKDYDVKISEEADLLDKRLTSVRERNKEMVMAEKSAGEDETAKTHAQYAQKVESQKKTGDDQIAKLQAYYKKAGDDLHHQFEKDQARAAQKGKNA
jgi:hypothetical protein